VLQLGVAPGSAAVQIMAVLLVAGSEPDYVLALHAVAY